MAVFNCDVLEAKELGLSRARTALRTGELVVFPTDTVYALGADLFNKTAVHSLLAAKKRDSNKPASVLIGSIDTLETLVAVVPVSAHQLIREFWPGALSLILPAASQLSCDLGQTNGTIMVRMPENPVALELLQSGPIAQSSANLTGLPPATTVEQAWTYLGPTVPVYLDGGSTNNDLPSTIVDLTTTSQPFLLREGALPTAAVSAVLDAPLRT
ncbi:L-threonylcarbamoyladenylate synthase [Rhodococcus sp. 008]|uniref:L-threonylcarbamoyladenylate synthase n=1 Tax=Rhodococcus sp. 008 TaxID=1723645 RepID=UPI0008060DDE|nr:L-threonylcarbamoyladenylate synthase [Rhodococcus sp. 008]ANQ71268.1 threonylcarbamoyl-AMP synthase [Rhodococcus sp. 008]